MKNEKDRYTEWIEQIKMFQPKIADPQKLILKTMQSVECLSKKKERNKTLIIVSWVSSIAASVLIALFLFEQFAPSTNVEYTSSKIRPDWVFKGEHSKKQRELYLNVVVKHKNVQI